MIKRMICRECGSDNHISIDACVSWNRKKQRYDVDYIWRIYCNECDMEVDMETDMIILNTNIKIL